MSAEPSIAREGRPSLVAGARLDRYELVRHVASGGMGAVWEGRFAGKHGFERRVAIKTVLPHLSLQPGTRALFLEEARVGAKVVHPNVAQILDVGDVDGRVYIAFEWVDGPSLDARYRRAPGALDAATVLHILADVCAGLEAAHALGVIHRDVKPRNILVGDRADVKLIDFGIAKARDRLCADTRSGLVRGTPEYMSPEQAVGAPLDARSDLWSVAAVLHRCLLGTPPLPDPRRLREFAERGTGLALPPALGPDLHAILSQGLARSRDARFESATEMRAALLAASLARGGRRVLPAIEPGCSLALADVPTLPEGHRAASVTESAPRSSTPAPTQPSPVRRADPSSTALGVALTIAAVATVVAAGVAVASLAG